MKLYPLAGDRREVRLSDLILSPRDKGIDGQTQNPTAQPAAEDFYGRRTGVPARPA
jgi:hypothetical protein